MRRGIEDTAHEDVRPPPWARDRRGWKQEDRPADRYGLRVDPPAGVHESIPALPAGEATGLLLDWRECQEPEVHDRALERAGSDRQRHAAVG